MDLLQSMPILITALVSYLCRIDQELFMAISGPGELYDCFSGPVNALMFE
jgi:hypothetical protein